MIAIIGEFGMSVLIARNNRKHNPRLKFKPTVQTAVCDYLRGDSGRREATSRIHSCRQLVENDFLKFVLMTEACQFEIAHAVETDL